jgi:predicted ArsR family transcriptional regulator
VLRDASLIDVRALPVIGSGRPRLAYTATDLVADEGDPGAYRLLARILTSSLQGRDGGLEEATLAGLPAGRRLVEGPKALGVDQQMTAVRALLDHLGFAPQPSNVAAAGSHVIELHQCPFRDLVEDGLSVVCAAHRGLIQGAYEGLGGDPQSLRLIPFASPGVCSVQLRSASKRATSTPSGVSLGDG